MVLLTLVVSHGVGKRKDKAHYTDVHPEEFESDEVHEGEKAPRSWSHVEPSPKHEGVCCADLFLGKGIVVALEDPFFLSHFIDLRPPPQIHKYSPCYVLHCPEIRSLEHDDEHESNHFIPDKEVEEQEANRV